MINKKLLFLSFLMFFAFLAICVYADSKKKNFVTVLNGANFNSEAGKNSYSFVGQPVVFATTEGMEAISQSAFASVFYVTQSSSITFENQTSIEISTNSVVTLKVVVKSTPTSAPDIKVIKYRIWEGPDVDWNNYDESPERDYKKGSISGKEVTFSQDINFSKGEQINYFRIYAQLENGARRWSEAYLVRLSSGLAADIKFTSPDELTGIAPLDPKIETTQFSLSFMPVTISLYKGEDKIYSVNIDTGTNAQLYDDTNSIISCSNSDLIKIYTPSAKNINLEKNKEYTLKIAPTSDPSKEYSVKFKAVSDGVADILTYPSPFNPKKQKVKIRYVLAKTSDVTIRLYDKAGKVVCKLIDGEERSAGTHEEEWDGRNYAGETLATGAYIVEIIAGSDRRYTALAIVGK